MKNRFVLLLGCMVLVAAAGGVHGFLTDRWGPSGQLQQAVAQLERVPMSLADWRGEDVPYEAEMLSRAGIKGGVFRRYTNRRTGDSVSVLMVCGRGGPISVHTPDVCYAGAGYRQLAPEVRKGVKCGDSHQDDLYVARFGKPNTVVPTYLEIYWAWSRDGVSWQAPKNPRLSLARAPALYKLYVVREYAANSSRESTPTIEAFLEDALPIIRQALSSTGS